MRPFKRSFDSLAPEVLLEGEAIRKRGILPEDPTASSLHVVNQGILKPGLRLPRFCHEEWDETIIVLSGEDVLHFEEGALLSLKIGDIAYVPAGFSHSLENTGSQDLVGVFFKVAAGAL